MITIKNTQRSIAIDVKKIKQDAQKILELLRYPDFDLGIWITTNKTIHHYNRQYRNMDKPTDILSFPFYPELKAGERIKATDPEEKNLGDLIIAPSYIQKQLAELNTSLEKRLQILLVHGICHLLGYDHIDDNDYKKMRAKELFLLKKIQ